ncbi:MAG TPA: flagellar biosynthesis protein FlhB [Stellaceae bacterium]|nr:flagellar biosynthesis protein FlhB [Stellaceae bacterium]
MAEERDSGQQTEEPSQRKLQQARRRGQVAQSREVNTWFMLMAGTGIVLFIGPTAATSIAATLRAFLTLQHYLGRDGVRWDAIQATIGQIAFVLLLPLLVVVAAAAGGTLLQIGLVFATEKLGFDLSRISPLAGFKRLFSPRSAIEFFKSMAKVAAVSAVAGWMALPSLATLAHMVREPAELMPHELYNLILRLLFGVLAVVTVLALFDYGYQRFSFLRSMRMSKQEVKEENKQAEGDPVIRARLRAIRMNRARKRMMAAVPKASVVITNPTHYAVALQYDMGDSGAPKVVAKGADLVALKIREIATEHDVPIVENPPLARALYAGVEIDREIPPEHYKAVAEIISYVFRLKGKLRPQAQTAR